ncbi:MAG: efflux RND transporter permease subunit, partial [Thiotrichaceae bacterium]|nr:efflux RND transporter permease subunit [Thiotrichaceae bacterium]
MLAKLIQWSIYNRFLVLMATVMLTVLGWNALKNTPLDAIPDLSDVQVIIKTSYAGQSPQVVEDQVTYPITTTMLSVPKAKVVRGYSFFGDSYVYVIFEDGTDLYWARSRVLEYLNQAAADLPAGVQPRLGPDATGVGWVYSYALVDKTNRHDLSELRSLQDWFLKYELQTVEGVAEVASVGGMVKQYQIIVDPDKLRTYNIPLAKVKQAVQNANQEVGGSVIELAEAEYMIRTKGYLSNIKQIETIPVAINSSGTPLLIRDIATVQLGAEMRRAVADLDGEGEITGGIIVMRYGENALSVIAKVKEKLQQLQAGLPKGVEIIETYDRSTLILSAVDNLKHKLQEEFIVVALVCLIFLFHLRSALVAIITLPIGILIAFIIMQSQGVNANIMSLGGIAIAIGAMVDAAIVMIENAHKHIEHWKQDNKGQKLSSEQHWQLIADAATEVGPALFFSLLIITLSFIPVFSLEAQEGRLFSPLAYTKTYAMAAAAGLSVTLVPVLMGYFIRGWIPSEKQNPISLILIFIYKPLLTLVLFMPRTTVFIAFLIMLTLFIPLQGIGGLLTPVKLPLQAVEPITKQWAEIETYRQQSVEQLTEWQADLTQYWKTTFADIPLLKKMASGLGTEFMPELYEGDLMYMPTTLPGVSIGKAQQLLQQTDRLIATFPEVTRVFGKIGRADTATDPAPLTMIETLIQLKPQSEWREGMTLDKLIEELDATVKFPGLTNAWVMPIKTRIDMLATGIKTPVGIKVAGEDLKIIEKVGQQIEQVLMTIDGTVSAYSERVTGGRYVEIVPNREKMARFGLNISDVNLLVSSAIGGANITETVEGLERYPVNLRFPRETRDNVEKLKLLPIITPTGAHISLQQVAEVNIVDGAPMLKSENARLNGWTFVDIRDVDLGTYIKQAQQIVQQQVDLPAGYSITWSGQYEYMLRAQEKLNQVVPFTLVIILLLLYLTFSNMTEALIVMATLPFALVGGFWLLFLLDFNLSVAVAVGFIALAGVAAEFGVVMLVYLDNALKTAKKTQQLNNRKQLRAAIMDGAVMRVRP